MLKKFVTSLTAVMLSMTMCLPGISVSAYAKAKKTKVYITPKTATIQVGKTKQLKLKNAKKKVKWKTSNARIATVSRKGVVRGIRKGTAKIRAVSSKKTYVCTVKVIKKTKVKAPYSDIPVHKHKWVPWRYKTVHHDEVYHYETKTVTGPITLITNGEIPNGSDEFVQKYLTEHPDAYCDYGYVSDGNGSYRARTRQEFYDNLTSSNPDPEVKKQYNKWRPLCTASYTDMDTIRSAIRIRMNRDGWTEEAAVAEQPPAVISLLKNVFTKHLTGTTTKKVKVVDRAAYDEKVVDYYRCSVCGREKE